MRTPPPAEVLEANGPKVSRWFPGLPIRPGDADDGALRVTRYVEEVTLETADGSVDVPSHHVRFSVWTGDHARASISIPEDEAEELSAFLATEVHQVEPDPRTG